MLVLATLAFMTSSFIFQSGANTVPRVVHFVFGFANDTSGADFGLLQFCAVKAAHDRLRPNKILMHLLHTPEGIWWEQVLHYVEVVQTDDVTSIRHEKVQHFAHKADIVRLRALQKYGGIYLDLDVWVMKSFDDLLQHEFVLGEEGPAGSVGLSNAVIVAKQNSRFLSRWLDAYDDFDSDKWNEHSIVLPHRLAEENPEEIFVLAHTHFAWPLWDGHGVTKLYLENSCSFLNVSTAVHLWSSKARAHHSGMTIESLWYYETCFTRMAREILTGGQKPVTLALKLHDVHTADILFLVPVDDLHAAVILAKSWVAYARSRGFRVVFYTTNPVLADDEILTTLGDVRLLEMPHEIAGIHETKAEWKTFEMLRILPAEYDGYKWYIKVAVDVLVRPEKLRQILVSYSPTQPFLLGSPHRFIGHLGTFDDPEDTVYQHITYPASGMYALSVRMVNELAPHAMNCLQLTPHEGKSIARCAQRYTGTGVTDIGGTQCVHRGVYTLEKDNYGFRCSTHEDMLVALRHILPEVSPAGRDLDGYVTLEHSCGVRCDKADSSAVASISLLEPRLSDPYDFRKHGVLAGIDPVLDRDMCFYTARPCGNQEGSSSRTDCHRAGCCYDKTREIKCFAKYGPVVLAGTNSSAIAGTCSDKDRQDLNARRCGSEESSEQECLALGCCYDLGKKLCFHRESVDPPPVQVPRSLAANLDHMHDLLGERGLRPEVVPWCEEPILNSFGSKGYLHVTLASDGSCTGGKTPHTDSWTLLTDPDKIDCLFIELDGFAQQFVTSNSELFDSATGGVLLAYNRDSLDELGPLAAADFVLFEFFERGYLVRICDGDFDPLITGDDLREALDGKEVAVLHMLRTPSGVPEGRIRRAAVVPVVAWCFSGLIILCNVSAFKSKQRNSWPSRRCLNGGCLSVLDQLKISARGCMHLLKG